MPHPTIELFLQCIEDRERQRVIEEDFPQDVEYSAWVENGQIYASFSDNSWYTVAEGVRETYP